MEMVTRSSSQSLMVVARFAAVAGFASFVSCANPVLGATTVASQNDVGKMWKTGGVRVNVNVPISGQPFKKAASITVPKKTARAYEAQVGTNPRVALKKGDALVATFYIRSTNPASGGKASFTVEGGPKYESSAWRDIALNNKWKKVTVPVVSKGTYGAGKWQTTFKVGAMAQTVQIADFRLTKK